MKRRLSLVLCAVLLTLSVAGCGQENAEQNIIEADSAEKIISEVTTANETLAEEKKMAIADTRDFYDGYAWALLESSQINNGTHWACVNKQGEIQTILTAEEYDFVNNYNTHGMNGVWQDGTYVIGEVGVPKRVIDTKGNIILECDDENIDVLCYGGGYYAILKNIAGFDKNEFYICFLSTDGKWTDIEIKLDVDSKYDVDVEYCGENVFYIGDDAYYNIKTDKEFEIDNGKYSYHERIGGFNQGYILLRYNIYQYLLVDTNGKITLFEEDVFKNKNIISNGITDGKIIYTYAEDSQNKVGYYDINNNSWNQLCAFKNDINFDAYTLYGEGISFENGNVFMTLEGADDKLYFAVYNENGEKLFEPITTEKFVGASCEMIVTNDENYCIYDFNGEKKFEVDAYSVETYSDDVAMVYDSNGRYYIDKNGNKLFNELTYNGETYKIVKY